MKNDILEKIKNHINNGIQREADVVYLMVEVRKVIDQELNSGLDKEIKKIKDSLYPLLKFYCDWVVHSRKDNITPEIESIMVRIDKSLSSGSKYPFLDSGLENIDFIYMDESKKQFKEFLEDFGLNSDITKKDDWTSFIQLLIGILIEQPIDFAKYNENNKKKGVEPIHSIKSFSFKPAAPGAAIWEFILLDGTSKKFGNGF